MPFISYGNGSWYQSFHSCRVTFLYFWYWGSITLEKGLSQHDTGVDLVDVINESKLFIILYVVPPHTLTTHTYVQFFHCF